MGRDRAVAAVLLGHLRRRRMVTMILLETGFREHGTGSHGRGVNNELEEDGSGIKNMEP